MERNKTSLVEWILSRPEGKQFLTALLLTVMALASCIVFMEIRYERNVDKIQNCEHEKQMIIKNANETLLNFLIEANARSERTKDKLDSLYIQLNMKK